VVPFSTVAPDPVEAFHHRIPAGAYPFFHPQKDVWAKGDMLTRVAFRWLDRVLLNGRYVAPGLGPDDVAAVQRTILAALEIHTNTLGYNYNKGVPALPRGIGLAEFTPWEASACRGVCFYPPEAGL
jgi:hypothetical protein